MQSRTARWAGDTLADIFVQAEQLPDPESRGVVKRDLRVVVVENVCVCDASVFRRPGTPIRG